MNANWSNSISPITSEYVHRCRRTELSYSQRNISTWMICISRTPDLAGLPIAITERKKAKEKKQNVPACPPALDWLGPHCHRRLFHRDILLLVRQSA